MPPVRCKADRDYANRLNQSDDFVELRDRPENRRAVRFQGTITDVGLSDPCDTAAYDAALARITVGSPTPLSAPIEVRDCHALRIREPDWFEHRMLRGLGDAVNLHVFSAGCSETDRMVRFRDHLRGSAADRELYARTKRELAAREWKYGQQYADAKTAVISEIMVRADAAL